MRVGVELWVENLIFFAFSKSWYWERKAWAHKSWQLKKNKKMNCHKIKRIPTRWEHMRVGAVDYMHARFGNRDKRNIFLKIRNPQFYNPLHCYKLQDFISKRILKTYCLKWDRLESRLSCRQEFLSTYICLCFHVAPLFSWAMGKVLQSTFNINIIN